jgi:broad specificity phosphatase PhoE
MKNDDFALKPEFLDPELSDKGIAICEAFQHEILEGIHPMVFVSPFLRAIHTACHVIKNLKGNEKLRLFLELLTREQTLFNNNMFLVPNFLGYIAQNIRKNSD